MAKILLNSKAELESADGFKVNCVARDKKIVLDEAEEAGGTDQGMNPLEAMLSALGACKCIVAKMSAEKLGIKIEKFSIESVGVWNPSGFTGDDPTAKIGFSKITTRYIIKSQASLEELKKFAEYVDRHCPVHDTIMNAPRIVREVTKI